MRLEGTIFDMATMQVATKYHRLWKWIVTSLSRLDNQIEDDTFLSTFDKSSSRSVNNLQRTGYNIQDLKYEGNRAMAIAIAYGDHDLVTLLITCGYDKDLIPYNALAHAVEGGNTKLALTLIANRCGVNPRGQVGKHDPLPWARRARSWRVLTSLAGIYPAFTIRLLNTNCQNYCDGKKKIEKVLDRNGRDPISLYKYAQLTILTTINITNLTTTKSHLEDKIGQILPKALAHELRLLQQQLLQIGLNECGHMITTRTRCELRYKH
jgi:hypothetical protein